MLPKSHGITYTFFDVNGGDAIWIRFLGDDDKWHNVLIDGGYAYTYKTTFGPLIKKILEDEIIDLWIITHTDLDHVGGVLGFIRDHRIENKQEAVKKIWFNHSSLKFSTGTGKLGISQGIELREYLEYNGLLVNQGICTTLPAFNLFGLKITILSPTEEKLNAALEFWRDKERTAKLGRKPEKSDHKKKIEELINDKFSEDTDTWNGGSIASLIEFNGQQIVLLADSHPTAVAETLSQSHFKDVLPIKAGFMQLSHHGSKGNNSQALLDLIETSTFVITGNGITNQHPDKETLVRALTKKGRKDNLYEFVFSSDNNALRSLFSVDSDPFVNYKFHCTYPKAEERFTSIEYFPIKKYDDE